MNENKGTNQADSGDRIEELVDRLCAALDDDPALDRERWANLQPELAEHPAFWPTVRERVRELELARGAIAQRREVAATEEETSSRELALGSLTAGSRVGDFRLVRMLGAGGMGQVWEADQESLRTRVALKLVKPDRAEPRALELLRKEARAGARLSHSNVVRTLSFGSDGELDWIAQELVPESRDLRGRIEELRASDVLPPGHFGEVARIVAEIADGLHAAHEVGIVHRDVKPANLLFTPDGTAKVTDFGLARLHGDSIASEPYGGTYLYMSPEQASGARDLDRRTDVFSLGIVLYGLLTLERPFVAASIPKLVEKIKHVDPPNPRAAGTGCPRGLATIAGKALQKSPARRYATMAVFAADLRAFTRGDALLAHPDGAVRKGLRVIRRHPLKASVALIVVVSFALVINEVWTRHVRAELATQEVGFALAQSTDLGRFRALNAAQPRFALVERSLRERAEAELVRLHELTEAKVRAQDAEQLRQTVIAEWKHLLPAVAFEGQGAERTTGLWVASRAADLARLERIVALDPTHVPGVLKLTSLLCDRGGDGDLSRSAMLIRGLAAAYPSELLPRLADAYEHAAARGTRGEGALQWDRLGDPDGLAAAYATAHHALRRKDHERAESLVRSSLAREDLDPRWRTWILELGCSSSERDLEELGARAQAVERALEVETAESANARGFVAAKLGRDYATAAACFRRSAELCPGSFQSLQNLGHALATIGEFEEAAASLEQAAARRPGYWRPLFELARLEAARGRFDEAERFAEQLEEPFRGVRLADVSVRRALDAFERGVGEPTRLVERARAAADLDPEAIVEALDPRDRRFASALATEASELRALVEIALPGEPSALLEAHLRMTIRGMRAGLFPRPPTPTELARIAELHGASESPDSLTEFLHLVAETLPHPR